MNDNSVPDPAPLICAAGSIFDEETVETEITQALASSKEASKQRQAFSAILKTQNELGRAKIEAAIAASPENCIPAIQAYSYLMDRIVQTALVMATDHLNPIVSPTKSEKLAVLAVGGYGREEMAPFSDVDLLFLIPYKTTAWCETVVETMLYILWDVKLKIGYSTRNIEECIRLGREDQTIQTALLESRFLAGDEPMAQRAQTKIASQLFGRDASDYVEQKLQERGNRHKRQGAARFMLEPNVKEGKGGLRDLQTLFWITKAISQTHSHKEMIARGYFTQDEFDAFDAAHQFLWTVRCHLHLSQKRAVEQLTFDAQIEVASRLGYEDSDGLRGVESFMQDYFRYATHVGDLTRIFLTALEAKHVKQQPSFSQRILNVLPWMRSGEVDETPEGYMLTHGRLNIAREEVFFADPLNIMRIFEEALRSEILIHPDAMRLIKANLDLIDDELRANPEARNIFVRLLLDHGDPVRALRRMNELGVLGSFIPEFERIVAMMQFNIYHHYTVDEHIIQCISELARIESGLLAEDLPVVTDVLKQGVNRRVLYIALLVHDIGKGLPEDHSIAGARMAQEIAPRLGLDQKETETVVWLVKNHLLMSDVAQKRDLSDPRTVGNFVKEVKTRSRLNLLTVLTVCDIRGVGPGTWNNWKAQLLRELYLSGRTAIANGLDKHDAHRVVQSKDALAETLGDWSKKDIATELDRHYDPYWQGVDHASHVTFAKLLKDIKLGELNSDITQDTDRDATRACFAMQDHPGLFSRFAGALALVGANVVDARSYTSTDGFATAVFWVQDADGKPFEQARLARLRTMISKTLSGEVVARHAIKDRDKLKKRERDFEVPTEITFDNEGSERFTIVEVDTRDRPGLLFDLTRTLADCNLSIASAVIATYGAQAVDVFYVKNMIGTKIHAKDKQQAIAKRLQMAIELGAEGAMS